MTPTFGGPIFSQLLTTISDPQKARQCDVHGIFFLKSSYVSLIFKSRLVVKILASFFLSYILPPEGVIILYGEKPNQTCSEKFKNGINLPHLWYKVFLYDLKGLRIIARSRKPKPNHSCHLNFVAEWASLWSFLNFIALCVVFNQIQPDWTLLIFMPIIDIFVNWLFH